VNEEGDANGFCKPTVGGDRTIARVCAEPRAGETRLEHLIPNAQGKSMVAVVVSYPSGGRSPAHHHAKSAFIYAYVLSGIIRSQVGDEPAKVYRVGEGFYEVPGSHHRISGNASDKEPASLLAVFVVDSKDKPLTTPDRSRDHQ
jgi:quercetin dioxygenase-like cupin family protein